LRPAACRTTECYLRMTQGSLMLHYWLPHWPSHARPNASGTDKCSRLRPSLHDSVRVAVWLLLTLQSRRCGLGCGSTWLYLHSTPAQQAWPGFIPAVTSMMERLSYAVDAKCCTWCSGRPELKGWVPGAAMQRNHQVSLGLLPRQLLKHVPEHWLVCPCAVAAAGPSHSHSLWGCPSSCSCSSQSPAGP
jgi:hypothetical protein